MNQLRLDELMCSINSAFGEELPFTAVPPTEVDIESLNRIFGDTGFQFYLQDQINRQVIRDYLTNAVLLGFVSEERLEFYSTQAGTIEGRALLSLHMLMSSVEEAEHLPLEAGPSRLQALRPAADSPPHMELVRN